jgi:signal transduction histidine kinase
MSRTERAARVLHDEVGGSLTVVGLQLDLLRMDHPDIAPRIEEIQRALDAAMTSVRELGRNLREGVE